MPKKSTSRLLRRTKPKYSVIIFIALFVVFGVFAVWSSLATSTALAVVEAESMKLPDLASVVSENSASGDQAVRFKTAGTATSQVSLPEGVISLQVRARGAYCYDDWPRLLVKLDGNTVVPLTTVSSSTWTYFSAKTRPSRGTHALSVEFQHSKNASACVRYLYVDVVRFFGSSTVAPPSPSPTSTPTPTPTVSVLPSSTPKPTPAPTPTPTSTPTPTPTPLASCAYPAQVLNLVNWKETLPTGSSGSPTEIKQPQLATYSIDPYFRANAGCSGVLFRAPTNGVTTSGSSYPRSELREMTSNGTANASWSSGSGTHTMQWTEAIMAVPQGKKHIVAGQIHDASDDVITIRLEYPKLFIDHNGSNGTVLTTNYALGTPINLKWVVSGNQVKTYYNGALTETYAHSGSGWYFKAGAYTQSNCSTESSAGVTCSASDYGEVLLNQLLVSHQ
jgi:hypothetical protein